MANKYYTNRYSFWSDNKSNIVKIDRTFNSYGFFEKNYFSDDLGVVKFFNLIRDRFGFPGDLTDVYQKFACDLSWAKNGNYCKVASSGGGSTGGGGGSTGGGGRISSKYHDCPTGPYTQGCKSEVIRKVQGCIGVKDDSLFGPKTQEALVSKGFKNGFTDADVTKLCTNQSQEDIPQNDKPTVVLPVWATCLKDLKKVSVSRDYDNVEIVRMPFDPNDKGYFWPTKEFLYLYKSGKEIRGSWSCDNNLLIIKTEDGQMWSKTNGWEPLVRKNNNNNDNINYQDDYTTYDDNENNYE